MGRQGNVLVIWASDNTFYGALQCITPATRLCPLQINKQLYADMLSNRHAFSFKLLQPCRLVALNVRVRVRVHVGVGVGVGVRVGCCITH